MKKTVLILVLGGLILSCLIAAAVIGYFGYRQYQQRASQEIASFEEEGYEPFDEEATWEKEEPWDEEEAQPEEEDSRQVSPGTEAPKPVEEPSQPQAEPRPIPPPRTTPPSEQAAPPPVIQEQAPPQPPAPTDPPPPPKVKVPKGTFSLIFESDVEQGEVKVFVDDEVLERQPFTASSQQKFRLEKAFRLLPGQHRVKIEVDTAGGKTRSETWNVMVVEKGNSIWKVEQEGMRKDLEIKRITAD